VSFGGDFLSEPELFPARPAGEPWGSERLRVDALGGPYVFLGVSAAQRAFLAAHYAPLALPGGGEPEDAPIRVFRVEERELRPVTGAPWTFRMDLDPAPSALRFATRGMFGRLDWRPALGVALWTPGGDDERRLGCFENALRLAAAYRLAEAGGALLHSAGVVAHGRAWLFFGRSGAGKSTLARISAEAGHEVLSDELNALVSGADGPRLERMPFAGDFGRTVGPRRSWPLAGAFALRQGTPPAREPLARAAAVAELTACAPFVNADPHRSPRLLENLERLTGELAVERLTFGLDPGFWVILTRSR